MQISECKCLLTGSEGRLGCRVKAALIAKGSRKIVYFDLKHGNDLLHRRAVQRACKDCNVTIHLAGLAHPGLARADRYIWTNVVGTLLLLEEAIRARHSRFIFVSSGTVYGWDLPRIPKLVPPIKETHPVALESTEPYTTSKIIAEQLVALYANSGLIQTIVLRLAPIWNANQAGAPRFFHAAVSAEVAVQAIVNSVQLEMREPVVVYNVADPDRRGDYCIDRAMADGIIQSVRA